MLNSSLGFCCVSVTAVGRLVQRYASLPVEVDRCFADFCGRTRRSQPDTIRAIIELFLADGLEAAERRLCSGLWEAPTTAASQRDAPSGLKTKLDRARRADRRPILGESP
jgi:hypothetical protein